MDAVHTCSASTEVTGRSNSLVTLVLPLGENHLTYSVSCSGHSCFAVRLLTCSIITWDEEQAPHTFLWGLQTGDTMPRQQANTCHSHIICLSCVPTRSSTEVCIRDTIRQYSV